MFGFGMDVGIDLGTASVLVSVKNKGIVLNEPSVVAVDRDTNKPLAIGEEARQMIGRTPGNIIAVRPMRDGVIADYDVTQQMLQAFIRKVCGKSRFFGPRLMIGVPSGITTVEQRAVLEAASEAGARQTWLIEEPLAAALGAGIDVSKPNGAIVVDIGGGTTDVAVISLGGIVVSEAARIAGDKLDEAIIRFMRNEYRLLIGERTAEDIKIQAGTAFPGSREVYLEVRGRDLVTGLPKNVTITSEQAMEAMQEPIDAIVSLVKSVLERTPPELAADIMDRGIIMTGGGALIDGLDKLMTQETGIQTFMAENPIDCVGLGTCAALDSLNFLEKNLISGRKR
ncbi:MAG: rod shape-determining protein MreB [Firmicutes bacterium]|jgi:rod shape-determining protein MreB|nr:rod shape-determining protein MreB [Bacillota bacterium]